MIVLIARKLSLTFDHEPEFEDLLADKLFLYINRSLSNF